VSKGYFTPAMRALKPQFDPTCPCRRSSPRRWRGAAKGGLGGFALTRGANFSASVCAVSRERQLPV